MVEGGGGIFICEGFETVVANPRTEWAWVIVWRFRPIGSRVAVSENLQIGFLSFAFEGDKAIT